MEDKRLMDNKIVKNPLLSGVDQTSFLQDFVHSSLIVPAAPPKLLQTTSDTSNSGPTAITSGNRSGAIPNVQLPGVPLVPPSSQSQLVLLPPSNNQQNFAFVPPPSIKSTSRSATPSDGSSPSNSITSHSDGAQTNPNKIAGPPPLTSYNRPPIRHPSSRYPASSFLQTIPSAQFFSQSNQNPAVNTLSNSPQSSNTTPTNYFVPQVPNVNQPTLTDTSSSQLLPGEPPLQICPPAPEGHVPDYSNLTGNWPSLPTASIPSLIPSNLSPSPTPVLQATHPSVLTPFNVVPSLQQPLLSTIPSDSAASIPSLPVSQPVIVSPVSSTLQSLNRPSDTFAPSPTASISASPSVQQPLSYTSPSSHTATFVNPVTNNFASAVPAPSFTTDPSKSVYSNFLPISTSLNFNAEKVSPLQQTLTTSPLILTEANQPNISLSTDAKDIETSSPQTLPGQPSVSPAFTASHVFTTPTSSLVSNTAESFPTNPINDQPKLLTSTLPISPFLTKSLPHFTAPPPPKAIELNTALLPPSSLLTTKNIQYQTTSSETIPKSDLSLLSTTVNAFPISANISDSTTNNFPTPCKPINFFDQSAPKEIEAVENSFNKPPTSSSSSTNDTTFPEKTEPIPGIDTEKEILSLNPSHISSSDPNFPQFPATSQATLFTFTPTISTEVGESVGPSHLKQTPPQPILNKDTTSHFSPPKSSIGSLTSQPQIALDTPPLIDPSKFFSFSPPSGNQFLQSSSLNPPQLITPPKNPVFNNLIAQKSNTLPSANLQTVSQTHLDLPVIKDSTSSAGSPSTSTSHTPPPPYSSLSFASDNLVPQVLSKDTIQLAVREQPDGISSSTHKNIEVNDEELDQIPLDGNTVPLYNPLAVGASTLHTQQASKIGSGNTYRLGSGLKRPSYAPVPDLGITHQVAQVFPTMSGAHPPPSLDLHQPTTITATTTPSNTPSSSVASSPPRESAPLNFNLAAQGQVYRAPYHHWFYKKGAESKGVWYPFTMADSLSLEQVFTSPDVNENTKVATDGGRYDVSVLPRKKVAVYWEEPPGEVRRCSWFVRSPVESRYVPYDENIAEILEDAYKTGCLKNEWNRKVDLADGEVIILHSPNAIAHHQRSCSPDAWGNPPAMQQKPRIVKRGLEDFEISEGEPNQVDHLLLMVHGIGKVCDLRFRSLVQVVDDFRTVSLQLVQSHFRSGTEDGNVGRVEVLPVEWHRALHTEIIDKRLSDITLPSIPKAREFTNDVLLDILFYTSPVFCERIVQAVGAEINRVYNLYMSRNPGFRGGVSLGGHSLGSLILFDMLCHQKPHRSLKTAFSPQSSIQEGDEDMPEFGGLKTKARLSRRMSYLTIGSAGTGQPFIVYPQLNFQPNAFFALGSPIGMFLTVRGIEGLGEEFKFPTCPKFFNIFHPNDPVAYRIEPLVSVQMVGVPAVVIPHHKGRKRMHLELKDTMTHVTAALKQKFVQSMRSTWNTVYQLAMFHRADGSIQHEVDKVIENEMLTNSECESPASNQFIISDQEALSVVVGCLNGGNRIDYVLQEAPLETFNQYISAVRSHVVYWESEDTTLLILKELYATMGISPDSQVPQPILPFDISPDSANDTYSEYTDSIGAPPTQFIRKQ